MSVRKNENGQAIVLMALALVVIMGMAALVVDVGSWYHTKRRLQGTADAAALADAEQGEALTQGIKQQLMVGHIQLVRLAIDPDGGHWRPATIFSGVIGR